MIWLILTEVMRNDLIVSEKGAWGMIWLIPTNECYIPCLQSLWSLSQLAWLEDCKKISLRETAALPPGKVTESSSQTCPVTVAEVQWPLKIPQKGIQGIPNDSEILHMMEPRDPSGRPCSLKADAQNSSRCPIGRRRKCRDPEGFPKRKGKELGDDQGCWWYRDMSMTKFLRTFPSSSNPTWATQSSHKNQKARTNAENRSSMHDKCSRDEVSYYPHPTT